MYTEAQILAVEGYLDSLLKPREKNVNEILNLLFNLDYYLSRIEISGIDSLLHDFECVFQANILEVSETIEALKTVQKILSFAAPEVKDGNYQMIPTLFYDHLLEFKDQCHIEQLLLDIEGWSKSVWLKPIKQQQFPKPDIINKLKAHNASIQSIQSVDNGAFLITLGADFQIKVWERNENYGQVNYILDQTIPSDSMGLGFTVSESSSLILWSRKMDPTILTWNWITQSKGFDLKGHEKIINHISVSNNGHFAVSVDQGGLVIVWGLLKGVEIFRFDAESTVNVARVDNNGESVFFNKMTKLFDTESLLSSITEETMKQFFDQQFKSQGNDLGLFVANLEKKEVTIQPIASLEGINNFGKNIPHNPDGECFILSENEDHLYFVTFEGAFKLNINTQEKTYLFNAKLSGRSNAIYCDEKLLVFCNAEGNWVKYDLIRKEIILEGQIFDYRIMPPFLKIINSEELLIGQIDGTIHRFKIDEHVFSNQPQFISSKWKNVEFLSYGCPVTIDKRGVLLAHENEENKEDYFFSQRKMVVSNIETGNTLFSYAFEKHRRGTFSTFSDDSRYLAWTDGWKVYLLDILTFKLIAEVKVEQVTIADVQNIIDSQVNTVNYLAFGQKHLYTLLLSGQLDVFEMPELKHVKTIETGMIFSNSFEIIENEEKVIVVGMNKENLCTVMNSDKSVSNNKLVFNFALNTFVHSFPGSANIVSLEDGKIEDSLQSTIGNKPCFLRSTFAPKYKKVWATSINGGLMSWDIEKKTEDLNLFASRYSKVECIGVLDEGKYIATGAHDGFFKIWDAENGSLVYSFNIGSSIHSLSISDDNKIILSDFFGWIYYFELKGLENIQHSDWNNSSLEELYYIARDTLIHGERSIVASRLLARKGEIAIPFIGRLITSPNHIELDRRVKRNLFLSIMRENIHSAIPFLEDFLKGSHDHFLMGYAFDCLYVLAENDAIPILTKQLIHDDSQVRYWCLKTMYLLDEVDENELLSLLDNESNLQNQEVATELLLSKKVKKIDFVLRRLVNHSNEQVRIITAKNLSDISDIDLIPFIKKLFQDASSQVYFYTMKTIGKLIGKNWQEFSYEERKMLEDALPVFDDQKSFVQRGSLKSIKGIEKFIVLFSLLMESVYSNKFKFSDIMMISLFAESKCHLFIPIYQEGLEVGTSELKLKCLDVIEELEHPKGLELALLALIEEDSIVSQRGNEVLGRLAKIFVFKLMDFSNNSISLEERKEISRCIQQMYSIETPQLRKFWQKGLTDLGYDTSSSKAIEDVVQNVKEQLEAQSKNQVFGFFEKLKKMEF